MSILTVLNRLESTNSRNEKIAILESYKDSNELRWFFKLALDPLITFGIRRIPDFEHTGQQIGITAAFFLLDKLTKREITGNAAIDFLAGLLASLSSSDAEVLIRCIEKDPKCGVSVSTVNKIWPELVKEFPAMKAKPYDENSILAIKWPAYSQTKLDGARCVLVCMNGKAIALSSSGREIEVHSQFDWCSNPFDEHVIDGELMVMDESGKFADRKTGNGIVNKALKGTVSLEEAKRLHFVAFDCIPVCVWNGDDNSENKKYKERLGCLVSKSKHFASNMSLVETLIVESERDAVKHFKQLMTSGEEGTILKNMDALWEDGRSKNCVKFKGILSCDLIVVDTENGTGKYADKLGNLICESSDGLLRVSVGSGFSDLERGLPTNGWIGKIVEVIYNERIIGKTEDSKWSLFLPRFGRVRTDKQAADSIDNIPLK